jgi:general secretion pathway protein F
VKFSVKALRGASDVVQLTIVAADLAEARRQAAGQGLSILSIRARHPLAAWAVRTRVAFPLELFIQELVSLLDAGMTLVETMDLLADKEQDRACALVFAELRADLRRGRSFADALGNQSGVFPPLFVTTVRVAERTGDIREAVSRFLAYQTQLNSVRRKVQAAAVYPAMLLAVGLLVTGFLLFYVVPRFSRIYLEIGVELPWLTRVLVGWGQLLEQHVLATLAGAALLVAAAVFVLSRTPVRRWLGQRLWRLPGVGQRLRVYQLTRFYRTLGMLLKSGLPLPTALDMAGALLSPLLRQGLESAARDVRDGQSVSHAFGRHGLTTPVSLRLLSVGERTGRMPEMVERIALFHEDALARWVDWFTRLFEPALMVLIGALVGLIVVLLYLPIFELAENIR